MINVLLVDDQTLVRQGIRSLLALSEQVAVVGEAQNGLQALEILLEQDESCANAIDLVLMDIRMPSMTGIEALMELYEKQIDIPVIMLTTFDDHESECFSFRRRETVVLSLRVVNY